MKALFASVAALGLLASPALAAPTASTKTVTTKSGNTKATTTVSTKGSTTTAKTTMTKAKAKSHHKARHHAKMAKKSSVAAQAKAEGESTALFGEDLPNITETIEEFLQDRSFDPAGQHFL